MALDGSDNADSDDEAVIKAYLNHECMVETTRGAYVRITLREAIEAVARTVVAQNGGIELGESIAIGTTVDNRASIQILVEHPDDATDLSDLTDDTIPVLAYEDVGKFGPS